MAKASKKKASKKAHIKKADGLNLELDPVRLEDLEDVDSDAGSFDALRSKYMNFDAYEQGVEQDAVDYDEQEGDGEVARDAWGRKSHAFYAYDSELSSGSGDEDELDDDFEQELKEAREIREQQLAAMNMQEIGAGLKDFMDGDMSAPTSANTTTADLMDDAVALELLLSKASETVLAKPKVKKADETRVTKKTRKNEVQKVKTAPKEKALRLPELPPEVDGPRGITKQIEKNRGLTRKRKKYEGHARVHNRLKYAKRLKRMSGVTRKADPENAMNYGGEASGITGHVRRSQKIS
eukprot:Blabericola_migrator_1__1545@NODE_1409_length_4611_cov_20_763424_g937_i0_p2_GENE_NODE_1409_length_4611_cov_20_763424_g937_i0NODE_1409_length_4611_cov_20_763424_g937_i0_p2_ORF_typecomplete_len295_score79_41Sas10/PF09368_10/2_1e03Sas10/PF09368_10/1_6e03Sas10/PF09368_10/2_9e21SPAM/PF02090_15/22SPAM/PF02090_15/43_NODE_1409_length_4611_cov_20_763424_g937_i020722956